MFVRAVDYPFVACNISGIDNSSPIFSLNVYGNKNGHMVVAAEWCGLCDYGELLDFVAKVCEIYGTRQVCFCSFKGQGGDDMPGLKICYKLAWQKNLHVPRFSKKWRTNSNIRTEAILSLAEALKSKSIVEHSEAAIKQYRAFMKDLGGFSTIADDRGEYFITNRAIGLLVFDYFTRHIKKSKVLCLKNTQSSDFLFCYFRNHSFRLSI